jgi:hypothetical protein
MREFLNRLGSFFQNRQRDRELDAEMESHFAFAIDKTFAKGWSRRKRGVRR